MYEKDVSTKQLKNRKGCGTGVRMKNRLYYLLFPVYAIVVAFVLYVNGVFTADESSMINLAINVGFLVIIGVIFAIAVIKFSRLNFITAELEELTFRLQKEYKEANGKNLWENYQDRGDVFESEELEVLSINTACVSKVLPVSGGARDVIWRNISVKNFWTGWA